MYTLITIAERAYTIQHLHAEVGVKTFETACEFIRDGIWSKAMAVYLYDASGNQIGKFQK